MEKEIKNRIERMIERLGMSIFQFAYETNISTEVIQAVNSDNVAFWLDVFPKITAKFPDLNPDWLLFGTGTMFKSDVQPSLPENEYHVTMMDNIIVDIKGEFTQEGIISVLFKNFKNLFIDYQKLLTEFPNSLDRDREIKILWTSVLLSQLEKAINHSDDNK